MTLELRYCENCTQMTNHIRFSKDQWQCRKCGKGNKKISPTKTTRKLIKYPSKECPNPMSKTSTEDLE